MHFTSNAINTFLSSETHTNTTAFIHHTRPTTTEQRPTATEQLSITNLHPSTSTLLTDILSASRSISQHNRNTMNTSTPTTPTLMPNKTTESNTDAHTDNYTMTSDDETPASNHTTTETNDLINTIDELQEELMLEHKNNNAARDSLTWQQEHHNKTITILNDKINHLRKLQQSQPSTPTPPIPTPDSSILALIKQQQETLNAHIIQNSQILAEFRKGIQSLQEATVKTAIATEKQTQETIDS
jgi:hypothetical protein